MKTVLATEMGVQTLVGHWQKPTATSPVTSGNCFSLIADGKGYRITNMLAENFEFLLAHYIEWPVEIKPVSERHAEIVDKRIAKQWFRKDRCPTCCGCLDKKSES